MKSKPTMLYATHVISHDLGALDGERRAVVLAAITISTQRTPQTIKRTPQEISKGVLDVEHLFSKGVLDVVVDALDDDEHMGLVLGPL